MGNTQCGPVRDLSVEPSNGGLTVQWRHPEPKGSGRGRAKLYRIRVEVDLLSLTAYRTAYSAAMNGSSQVDSVHAGLTHPLLVAAGVPAPAVPGPSSGPAQPVPADISRTAFDAAEEAAFQVVIWQSASHPQPIAPQWQEVHTHMERHVPKQQLFEHRFNGLRNEVHHRISVGVVTDKGDVPFTFAGPITAHRTPPALNQI